MRALHGTYVHRGDAVRRRRRLRRAAIASAAMAATVIALAVHRTLPADAESVRAGEDGSTSFFSFGKSRELRNELESTKGELSLVRAQFDRADKIIQFSTTYAVTADLAGNIFDASSREGIDPDLAFRLVRLESDFNAKAVSKAGAIGLTQLMPSTARLFERSLGPEQLLNPRTNLRVGFRYLRSLLDQYNGNVRLALLAYNRGEDAVWRDVKAGVNPGNGYDRFVLGDYKGPGLAR
jgi:soluble lytic murein transglycosylase-like protein